MQRLNYLVDVLVLVPEYSGRNALIESAFELVNSLSKHSPFKYTLVNYAEDDPRYDIDYDRAYRSDKYVSFEKFTSAAEEKYQPDLMQYEGKMEYAPFDYMDSPKSFKARALLAQRWIEEDLADDWYEMNRPDFEFSPESTLGVIVNPYPHEDNISSGPVSGVKNIATVQSTICEEDAKCFGHIYLAYELMVAPVRFLLGHDQEDDWVHKPSFDCINDLKLTYESIKAKIGSPHLCGDCEERIISHFGSHQILEFLRRGFQVLKEKDDNIKMFEKTNSALNMQIIPKKRMLYVSEIGIFVKLTAKEFALYHYLIEHPKGLSKSLVAQERKVIFDYHRNIRFALTDQIKKTINILIDGWQYTNDLRLTVSRINQKFRVIEHLPGMKAWCITRVGDHYRLYDK